MRPARATLVRRAASALVALAAAMVSPLPSAQAPAKPQVVAPYVDTPTSLVAEMLALANVGPGDFVVDLGSGDGRLVITAVTKFGARGGFGVDIDPTLVRRASENARQAGVADRVEFFERDLFATDVSKATVVTIYLLPSIMPKVEAKLRAELRPGARVVVHDYPFPTWRPVRVIERESLDKIRIIGDPFAQLWLYVR
jgi:protein-L-isoaspartate O-methyltransferase